MNYDQILQPNFTGVRLIEELTPEGISEIQRNFVNQCVDIIVANIDQGIQPSLVFPANGAVIFLEAISKAIPDQYKSSIEWIIASKETWPEGYQYMFVSNKSGEMTPGNALLEGFPIIIDDIYDSGNSYDVIESLLKSLMRDEDIMWVKHQADGYTAKMRTRGEMGLPILACTTKQGKPYPHAVYTFPSTSPSTGVTEDQWVTSSLGLDGGFGGPQTSRKERLSGVAFAAESEEAYRAMMSDPIQVSAYERYLQDTGVRCYGAESYVAKEFLLSLMDDKGYPVSDRCRAVFDTLPLIPEA